jgi:hypothetical protein
MTLCNISSFFTRSVQLISVLLQNYISKLPMVILYIKEKLSLPTLWRNVWRLETKLHPVLTLRLGGDKPNGRYMCFVKVDNLFHLAGVKPLLCDSVEMPWDPEGFRLSSR